MTNYPLTLVGSTKDALLFSAKTPWGTSSLRLPKTNFNAATKEIVNPDGVKFVANIAETELTKIKAVL